MKNTIYITNDQDKLPVDQALLGLIRRAVNKTLLYEDFGRVCEISVTLTDNEKIRELNRSYRNIDRATDVLSFPLFDDEFEDEQPLPLGDIVISLEKAKEQSEEFGHSFQRECAFLTVHSMLHLLGYDHETGKEDEKDMFFRQEEVMKLLNLPRTQEETEREKI